MNEMTRTEKEDCDRIRTGLFLNCSDLELYLSEKARNHNYYKYYSSKRAIQSICEDHSILLSDGENWNDKFDKRRMNSSEKYRYFGFCFSFSASENVAMWMLYSQDDGCMIDFDKDTIKSIMNPYEIEVGEFSVSTGFHGIDRLLVNASDIRFQLSDVLYVGMAENPEDANRFCYVRRSGETNKEFDLNLLDDNSLFIKGLQWFYENECRLIVSVPEDILSHHHRGLRLKISFDEAHINRLRNKKRIFNSPNVGHVSEDDFYLNNSDSKLTNGINWNLRSQFCSSCPKKV